MPADHAIWKFPLPIEDAPTIAMPVGAEVLHAGLDPAGNPCVWALVAPANEPAPVYFRIVGSGNPVDADDLGEHISTFTHGMFVWHVFEG